MIDLTMDLMKVAEQAFAGEKKELPAFKAGDQITVGYRIKEGNKERVQEFRGDVIFRLRPDDVLLDTRSQIWQKMAQSTAQSRIPRSSVRLQPGEDRLRQLCEQCCQKGCVQS